MVKKEDKLPLIILVIFLLLFLSIVISLIVGYYWGKGNGYNKYSKEHQAELQDLETQRGLLQKWEGDLRTRETNLNNSEFIINECQSNLENLTKDYNKCKQKIDNPNFYIFNLNYSYNEINIVILLIFFYIPITFTLFKIIIKDKNWRIVMNVISFIVLVAIIILMGVQ